MSLTSQHPAETRSEQRPWGSWEVLDEGSGFKVKRLTVLPHSRLSLQVHEHRAEHWLVVAGIATCTVGEQELLVSPGGHVLVPQGAVHRIANTRATPLHILELQLGAYTGEDDIIRLQDDHGRV